MINIIIVILATGLLFVAVVNIHVWLTIFCCVCYVMLMLFYINNLASDMQSEIDHEFEEDQEE